MMYMAYNAGDEHHCVTVLDNGDSIEEIHDWETGKNTTVITTEHLDENGVMTRVRHIKEQQ